MRSYLKVLITKILTVKAAAFLKKENVRIIFVLGETYRSVWKDELVECFIEKGRSVRSNAPGYNFRLGAVLTILGSMAGTRSFTRWIKILFNKPQPITEDVLIQEFVIKDEGDTNFLSKLVPNPTSVLVSDLGSVESTNAITRYLESLPSSTLAYLPSQLKEAKLINAIIIGSENGSDIEVISFNEEERDQKVIYRLNAEHHTIVLSKFGAHYAYPRMSAHDMLDKGVI